MRKVVPKGFTPGVKRALIITFIEIIHTNVTAVMM